MRTASKVISCERKVHAGYAVEPPLTLTLSPQAGRGDEVAADIHSRRPAEERFSCRADEGASLTARDCSQPFFALASLSRLSGRLTGQTSWAKPFSVLIRLLVTIV